MKKKMLLRSAVALCAGFLVYLANMASASACLIWFYQPEEPKALRK